MSVRSAEMRSPVLPTLLALSLILAQPVRAETTAEGASNTTEPSSKAPTRPPLQERSQGNAAALERQLPKNEQQMLQADQETFLALWKPANAPEAKGLIILVPGADESADWPQVIQPLRLKLPDIGWSTLSLTLPDSLAAPLPPALMPRTPEPAAADSAKAPATDPAPAAAPTPAAPETNSTPTPVDPSKRVFARIQAGISFAEQQGTQHIVLLGHGDGAYWAALFLKEGNPEQVKQLVTVAAQLPPGQAPTLEELIPGLKLATVDIYYQDQTTERSAALLRQQASKRLGHDSYKQIALKALPGNPEAEQEQLFRRVRGWLEKKP